MTQADFLRRVFELADDAPHEHYVALMYGEVEAGIPTQPWWPPLAQVWHEECEAKQGTMEAQHWAEARALLDTLHAEFRAHRKRNDD